VAFALYGSWQALDDLLAAVEDMESETFEAADGHHDKLTSSLAGSVCS
jgi:hypothetical protein